MGGGGQGNGRWRSGASSGITPASTWIALHASQYLHHTAPPGACSATCAVNARTGAGRNPAAIYAMTLTDHSTPAITTPFGLYDGDVPATPPRWR